MEQGKDALWLFAIAPPQDIARRIDDLRKEFSANFNCVKALKPPVHLTLYEPFKLPDADMEAQLNKLRRLVATNAAFRLELKNFNFFENPKSPVLYIDIVPNANLKALKTGIVRETKKVFGFEDLSKKAFRPHLTIGYRDIPPEIFPQVKQAYSKRSFSAVFKVDHISIFRHNRKQWMELHRLPLADDRIEQGSLW